MQPTVLLVPGYTNSGPEHWQSLWERANLEYRRVQQRDWNKPVRDEWIETLHRTIRLVRGPVVLVGHSCGSVTIAQWATELGRQPVVGALLVAPADCDAPDAIPEIRPLGSMPRDRLPFPSILVASTDDPYLSLACAREFAAAWGSRLHVMKGAGHINTASGFGPWPEGERLLTELCSDTSFLD